jgi:hypothetical protein
MHYMLAGFQGNKLAKQSATYFLSITTQHCGGFPPSIALMYVYAAGDGPGVAEPLCFLSYLIASGLVLGKWFGVSHDRCLLSMWHCCAC